MPNDGFSLHKELVRLVAAGLTPAQALRAATSNSAALFPTFNGGTNFYTKAVLTVIAGCLIWICVNGMTPIARAQADPPPPTPVILVDQKGRPLSAAEGLRLNLGAKPVPVFISNASLSMGVNASLPVDVRSIQRGPRWDPVEVRVLREPPTLQPIP